MTKIHNSYLEEGKLIASDTESRDGILGSGGGVTTKTKVSHVLIEGTLYELELVRYNSDRMDRDGILTVFDRNSRSKVAEYIA